VKKQVSEFVHATLYLGCPDAEHNIILVKLKHMGYSSFYFNPVMVQYR